MEEKKVVLVPTFGSLDIGGLKLSAQKLRKAFYCLG